MKRVGKIPNDVLLDEEGMKLLDGYSVSLSNEKYGLVRANGQQRIHRFIWEQRYGEAPELIDHINGNPKDNRFCNLRAATKALNTLNSKKRARRSASHLPVGVTVSRNKTSKPYVAQIKFSGRSRNLGQFKTPEEAHAAYMGARAILILEEQLKAEKEWLHG